MPGWVDYDRAMYGTGDLDDLGVKVALDQEGPPLDPDAELPAAGATEPARPRLPRRALPGARGRAAQGGPLLPLRAVAGLELLRRPPPGLERTWVIGGGSGHGFKHGPAVAERMAGALRGGEPLPERFRLGHREAGRSFRTAGSGAR